MDDTPCRYPGNGGPVPSYVNPDFVISQGVATDPFTGNRYFFDRWPRNMDPCEGLAAAMMEADFARADDHAHSILLEDQTLALECEMRARGIIDETTDFVYDPIAIPGMNRIDFDSLEGCPDESDEPLCWPRSYEADERDEDEPQG